MGGTSLCPHDTFSIPVHKEIYFIYLYINYIELYKFTSILLLLICYSKTCLKDIKYFRKYFLLRMTRHLILAKTISFLPFIETKCEVFCVERINARKGCLKTNKHPLNINDFCQHTTSVLHDKSFLRMEY